jgi:hypothetical protein
MELLFSACSMSGELAFAKCPSVIGRPHWEHSNSADVNAAADADGIEEEEGMEEEGGHCCGFKH